MADVAGTASSQPLPPAYVQLADDLIPLPTALSGVLNALQDGHGKIQFLNGTATPQETSPLAKRLCSEVVELRASLRLLQRYMSQRASRKPRARMVPMEAVVVVATEAVLAADDLCHLAGKVTDESKVMAKETRMQLFLRHADEISPLYERMAKASKVLSAVAVVFLCTSEAEAFAAEDQLRDRVQRLTAESPALSQKISLLGNMLKDVGDLRSIRTRNSQDHGTPNSSARPSQDVPRSPITPHAEPAVTPSERLTTLPPPSPLLAVPAPESTTVARQGSSSRRSDDGGFETTLGRTGVYRRTGTNHLTVEPPEYATMAGGGAMTLAHDVDLKDVPVPLSRADLRDGGYYIEGGGVPKEVAAKKRSGWRRFLGREPVYDQGTGANSTSAMGHMAEAMTKRRHAGAYVW